MSDFVRNIVYCIEVVNEQIPLVLVYYSHISVMALSAFFAVYVLLKNRRDILSNYFFALNFLFILWVANDLITWVLLYDSALTMFAWSTLELIEVSFFFVCLNFAYYFLFEKKIPPLVNFVLLLPVLAVFYVTVTGQVLLGYDAMVCEAVENDTVIYQLALLMDLFYLAVIAATYIYSLFKTPRAHRWRNTLFFAGLLFFLTFYLAVLYLSDYIDDYNWSLFALGGMPVFLAIISFAAVRYGIFNFKILGAQVLVFASIFLVAVQFVFIQSPINIILNSITTVLLMGGGALLIRSVKKVEEQRIALEIANSQQVTLIHFITHQIKGFVTKSRNIFAMMREGDYGALPEAMKPIVEEGFRSDTQGVATIQEILNASNIKSGKVSYTMAPFDLKALIDEIAAGLRSNAEAKGLTFTVDCGTEPMTITGDRAQLVNAFKNLIDNSIKYTPQGEVNVSLTKTNGLARFEIHDTGVGITPEDMKNLFTEGGHGKESTKVNVESTGFGLYIVKNIIEAHKGKVWAESEGAGKGSRFVIELPA